MPEKQAVDSLEKTFDPAHFEERWYSRWEKDGRFRPEGPVGSPRFVMVIPPPNVTGRLHIGHAYGRTVEDILARWKRMRGRRVLWLPGTDHAGHRHADGGRARAREGGDPPARPRPRGVHRARVGAGAASPGTRSSPSSGGSGARSTGAALRFTMDPDLSRAVRHAFVRLYRDGSDLPRPLRRELVPALRDGRLGPRGRARETAGTLYHVRYDVPGVEGAAIVRHDAARDDARRHGAGDPSRRRAVRRRCAAGRRSCRS